MKIGEGKPTGPVRGVASRGYGATPAPGAAAPRSAAAPAADQATILGIPEAELTPKVRDAIASLMAEVDRLRRELEQSQSRFAELERFANLDPLVPVLNRRAFVREMGRVISFSERYQMPASLIYLDLNNFKEINDAWGHAAGDSALVQVGRLLTAHVRETDVVGRLGGDEFGVILAQANEDVAQRKAESLAGLIEQTPIDWQNEAMRLSAAFGVYTFRPGEDAAAVMENADRAMFQRKRNMKTGS